MDYIRTTDPSSYVARFIFALIFFFASSSTSEKVGGGTSGCALAATLSQGAKVLVLERGDLPYDGVVNQRARVLGGGSALNSGFFSKAEPDFINKAGLDPKLVRESYEWVAKKVEFEPKVMAWQGAVRDGLLEAGVLPNNGFTLEHLYGTKVGGSIFDKNGRRHTAADLLEYEPEAIGVLYKDKKGKEHTAVLNEGSSLNEVILTAGTLGSPKLLMLSGIGPSEQLTAHKIIVVLHQPMVGQGLSDNPMNILIVPTTQPIEVSLVEAVAIGNYPIWKLY
ncbi:HOTHEAD-like protein [Tanacetum coccineum]